MAQFVRILAYKESAVNVKELSGPSTCDLLPFTIYCARVLSAGVELSDENIAHIVMQLIASSMPDPEVEYLFGERRDNSRSP